MNSGPLLQTEDLPSPLQNHFGAARADQRSMAATAQLARPSASLDTPAVFPLQPVILPLSEIEKRAILEALAYTKGDHTTAAQLLGIGRTTLYRKLKEYRLEGPESRFAGSTNIESPEPGFGWG